MQKKVSEFQSTRSSRIILGTTYLLNDVLVSSTSLNVKFGKGTLSLSENKLSYELRVPGREDIHVIKCMESFLFNINVLSSTHCSYRNSLRRV